MDLLSHFRDVYTLSCKTMVVITGAEFAVVLMEACNHVCRYFTSVINRSILIITGAYISQLIRYYSRACAKYSDFLDITQLLTQELLKQDYVTLRLKSSLQNFYDRYHHLVDPYEISISQMTMNRFLFT
jgi:hypothetical protein